MQRIVMGGLALALLAGCSERAEQASAPQHTSVDIKEAPQEKFGFHEAMQGEAVQGDAIAEAAPAVPRSIPADATKSETNQIPVSLPKIAYSYAYGFRIAGKAIPELQRKHADYCEKQGPRVCRVLNLSQNGAEGDYADGTLNLEVAAPRARAFGGELAKIADSAGGEAISTSIQGEDLSKQIVDTEARLRARTLLRDRLMEVLATRKGSVAELVEAERGVAQVNEEIDEARSWLTEMNGRVDFSKVQIDYSSGSRSGGGFLAPIRAVTGNLGAILGVVVAGLIVLATVLLPLGLLFWAIRKGWRRWRKRPEEAE